MASPIARWAAPMAASALAFAVLASHVPTELRPDQPLPVAVAEARAALASEDVATGRRAYASLHRAINRCRHGELMRQALEVGVMLGEKVLAERPRCTEVLLQLGFQHLRLADLDRVAGRPREAQAHIQAAYDLLVRLRIEGPGHPGEAGFRRSIRNVQNLLRHARHP